MNEDGTQLTAKAGCNADLIIPLTANWLKTYQVKIKYDNDNIAGTGTYVCKGDILDLSAVTPELKAGYEHEGWKIDEGSESFIQDGNADTGLNTDAEITISDDINGNIVLIPQYKANEYEITFDLKGMDEYEVAIQDAKLKWTYDQSVGKLPTPTGVPANMQFDGWFYENNEGSQAIRETDKYTTAENSTVIAKWTPKINLSLNYPEGGSVTLEGRQDPMSIGENDTAYREWQALEVKCNEGYYIESILVNNTNITVNGEATSFTYGDYDGCTGMEFQVNFAKFTYSLSVFTSESNGCSVAIEDQEGDVDITDDTTATVSYGSKPSLKFELAPNYYVSQILVDGKAQELSGVTDSYTLDKVKQNTSVIIFFDESDINVTANVRGENGTILPTESTVAKGSEKTFTITPAEGYEIDTLTKRKTGTLVNEDIPLEKVNKLANGSYNYTFENIDDGYQIEVSFKKIQCSITVNEESEQGTITVQQNGNNLESPYKVEYGSEVSLEITPSTGYYIKSVTWNDEQQDVGVGSSAIKLANKVVTKDSNLTVNFEKVGATVQVNYNTAQGTVKLNDAKVENESTIPVSDGTTLSIKSATGYDVEFVKLKYKNGFTKDVALTNNMLILTSELITNSGQTLNDIEVTFKVKKLTIKVQASESGEAIDCVGLSWTGQENLSESDSSYVAEYGTENIVLTVTPNDGYHISQVQVGDGNASYSCFNGKNFSYTITSLTSNVDITLNIAEDSGNSFTTNEGDKVEVSGGDQFKPGETRTIVVTVPPEKELGSITIGGQDYTGEFKLAKTNEGGDRVYTYDYQIPTNANSNIEIVVTLIDRMCSVKWSINGSSNNKPINYGNQLTFEKAEMSRVGYTFANQCTVGETNIIFSDEGSSYTSDYKVTSDITLEPQWTAKEVNLLFAANGGTTVPNIKTQTAETVTLPETSKEGHTFKGWKSSLKEGLYVAGSEYTVPAQDGESISFEAQWQINKYEVTFMNGNEAVQTNNYDFGTLLENIKPTEPTKEGYKFKGWSLDSTNVVEDDYKVPAKGITLYALWQINTYKVTFNYQDGHTAPKTVTVDHGSAVESPQQPTRDGFIFRGWSTTSDELKAVDFTKAITGNVTYYAIWAKRTEDNTIKVYVDGAEKEYASDSTVLSLGSKTKEGHTFIGWSLTENGDVLDSNVKLINEKHYYSAFKINTYNVTFMNGAEKLGEKTVEYAGQVSMPSEPEKEGYKFLGWAKQGSNELFDFTTPIKNDLTLEALWEEAGDCTITFESNGGSAISAKTVEYNTTAGSLESPTKTGAIFIGWYEDVSLKNAFDANKPVKADKTLYAKWNEKKTVEIIVDGEEVKVEVYDGATVGDLAKPTRPGYKFDGWYSDANCKSPVYDSTKVEEEMKIYVKWSPIDHTLKFLPEDLKVSEVTKKTNEAYELPVASKAGYNFNGWKCRYDGQTYKAGVEFKVPETDDQEICFDAQFTAIPNVTCVVIPVIDGKQQTLIVKTVKDGEKLSSLEESLSYDKNKQTFKGWYSSPEFKDDQKLKSDTRINDGQVVYARIESNKKQISSIVFPKVKDLEYGTLSIDDFNKTIEGGKIKLQDGSEVDITEALGYFKVLANNDQKETIKIGGVDKETLKITTTTSKDDGQFKIEFVPSEEAKSKYNFDGKSLEGTVEFMVYILGDVNGDGEINASDAGAVAEHVARKTLLTQKQKVRANVFRNSSQDWNITSDNTQKIKDYVARKITKI